MRPVHAGDLRIEAWAATREECVAEAVEALVGSFTRRSLPAIAWTSYFDVTGAGDTELLRGALLRVISGLRKDHVIPVSVQVSANQAGLRLRCAMVDAGAILPGGALPMGVTPGSVHCVHRMDLWWCVARIDV